MLERVFCPLVDDCVYILVEGWENVETKDYRLVAVYPQYQYLLDQDEQFDQEYSTYCKVSDLLWRLRNASDPETITVIQEIKETRKQLISKIEEENLPF